MWRSAHFKAESIPEMRMLVASGLNIFSVPNNYLLRQCMVHDVSKKWMRYVKENLVEKAMVKFMPILDFFRDLL